MKTPKKKAFVIDKITEDSFYENLLLGLTSVLKQCPFVSQIKLDRCTPATIEEVTCWECAYGTRLAEDMRNFYLSTNGFSFSYKFQYDKEETEEITHIIGGIEINPMSKLEQLATQGSTYITESGIQVLAPHGKIFALSKIDDENYVVMAQFNQAKSPSFWLYYKMKNFYLLCDDYTTYFRMALAHLGIPGWQFAALNAAPPEWSAELFQIMAPGVLGNRQLDENQPENNILDMTIFTTMEVDTTVLTPRSFNDEGKKEVGNVRRKWTKTKVKK